MARTATASVSRRKQPIASCLRWPATGRISEERRSARCSPIDAPCFEKLIAEWPADARDHAADLRSQRLQRRNLRRHPVDPMEAPCHRMIGVI